MARELPSGPSVARVLALNRTVGIVLLTVLFFGLGVCWTFHRLPFHRSANVLAV